MHDHLSIIIGTCQQSQLVKTTFIPNLFRVGHHVVDLAFVDSFVEYSTGRGRWADTVAPLLPSGDTGYFLLNCQKKIVYDVMAHPVRYNKLFLIQGTATEASLSHLRASKAFLLDEPSATFSPHPQHQLQVSQGEMRQVLQGEGSARRSC